MVGWPSGFIVVASHRSKAVLRVADLSDSIMLRSSSVVKEPAQAPNNEDIISIEP